MLNLWEWKFMNRKPADEQIVKNVWVLCRKLKIIQVSSSPITPSVVGDVVVEYKVVGAARLLDLIPAWEEVDV